MNELETNQEQAVRCSQQSEPKDEKQFVVFTLSREKFAIDIGRVKEIITMQELTTIPRSADHVKGIINLRGTVIPVFDLAGKLGVGAEPTAKSTRIMVVEVRDYTVGIIVDAVSEVLRIPRGVIEQPSGIMTGISEHFIDGIAKYAECLVIILNLDMVLTGFDTSMVS